MRAKPIEERALHAHIRKRTVRLLDFTDKSKGGSGVTVQLEHRFFVATAAHVIPKDHEIRILDGANQINTFENWQLDKENDVGFLELSSDTASVIDREFSTRIMLRLEQTEDWATTLIGYPRQSIETQESVRDQTLYRKYNFHTLTLVSELIPTSDWPKSGDFRRRPPQDAADVFVRFDSHGQLFEQDLTDLDQSELPKQPGDVLLAGMSGCGIWLDRYHDNGIWRPEPALFAIQTGANARHQWARGTQVKHWLQLVVQDYPDLTRIADQLH
jgi:hypothetical protein